MISSYGPLLESVGRHRRTTVGPLTRIGPGGGLFGIIRGRRRFGVSAFVNRRTWRRRAVIPDQWVKELLVKPLSPRLTRFGDNEGVVAEGLCDQSDRDPAEGAPHELFRPRFREVERHNRNVILTLAPRRAG